MNSWIKKFAFVPTRLFNEYGIPKEIVWCEFYYIDPTGNPVSCAKFNQYVTDLKKSRAKFDKAIGK